MGNSNSINTGVDPQVLTANLTFISKKHDTRYGQISLYEDKNSHETVVLKEIHSKSTQEFKEEIANLAVRCANHPDTPENEDAQGLNTPNLLKVLGFASQIPDSLCATFYKTLVVLEYLEQDLEHEIAVHKVNGDFYTEQQIWYLIESLLSALSALQRQNVVLGDIKPSTVLVSKLGVYKLADPSLIGNGAMPGYTQRLTGVTDIRTYLSPQLLKSLADQELKPKHNAAKSDVFAAGLTVLHAASLSNCDGFYDYDQHIFNVKGLKARIDSLGERYSHKLRKFIAKLLVIEEEDRADAVELSQELGRIRWRETLKNQNEESEVVVTAKVEHHKHTSHKLNSGAPENHDALEHHQPKHQTHQNEGENKIYVGVQAQNDQIADASEILKQYHNQNNGSENTEVTHSNNAHTSGHVESSQTAQGETTHHTTTHQEATTSYGNNKTEASNVGGQSYTRTHNEDTTAQNNQYGAGNQASYSHTTTTTTTGGAYPVGTTYSTTNDQNSTNKTTTSYVSQTNYSDAYSKPSVQEGVSSNSQGTPATGADYTKPTGSYASAIGTNYATNYGSTSYSSPTRAYGNYTTTTTSTTNNATTTGDNTVTATPADGNTTTTTTTTATGAGAGLTNYGSYLSKYQPLSPSLGTTGAQNTDGPSKYAYKPSADVEKIIGEVMNKPELYSNYSNYTTSGNTTTTYKPYQGASTYTNASNIATGTDAGQPTSYVSTYKREEGQHKVGEVSSPHQAGQAGATTTTQETVNYTVTYKAAEPGPVTTTVTNYVYNPDPAVRSIIDHYRSQNDAPSGVERYSDLDLITGTSAAAGGTVNANVNVEANLNA